MKSLNLILAAMTFSAVSASAASILDGYEKLATYNAKEAAQKKSAWQVKNYAAGRVAVKEGKVLIDNGLSGREVGGTVNLRSPDLYQLDGAKVSLKAKLQIVKANGTDNAFTFSISCGDGAGKIKNTTIFVAPGKIVVGGYGTVRTPLIQLGKPFEFIMVFAPQKSEVTVYIDGKEVTRKVKELPVKQENVWFGDGSGMVSGQVEIEFIELYKLEK